MMNKIGKLIPLIAVFVCAVAMLIVNLCDVVPSLVIGFLVCWSILLGVSGILLIERTINVIEEIKENKDDERK